MFQMFEEQPIGTKLTQLQATDVDSNIEAYQLSTNDYLEINNLTGTRDAFINNKMNTKIYERLEARNVLIYYPIQTRKYLK